MIPASFPNSLHSARDVGATVPRGGGGGFPRELEPRQSGSTEDLGLPRCLVCSHARSQWSDCAGWALAERGWLGACHGCVDTLGCSSRICGHGGLPVQIRAIGNINW